MQAHSLHAHDHNFTLSLVLFSMNRANGWTLVNMPITSDTLNCVESDHCAYATGTPNVARTATTPPLDLRIVTAVTPPPAPTNHVVTCSNTVKM